MGTLDLGFQPKEAFMLLTLRLFHLAFKKKKKVLTGRKLWLGTYVPPQISKINLKRQVNLSRLQG